MILGQPVASYQQPALPITRNRPLPGGTLGLQRVPGVTQALAATRFCPITESSAQARTAPHLARQPPSEAMIGT